VEITKVMFFRNSGVLSTIFHNKNIFLIFFKAIFHLNVSWVNDFLFFIFTSICILIRYIFYLLRKLISISRTICLFIFNYFTLYLMILKKFTEFFHIILIYYSLYYFSVINSILIFSYHFLMSFFRKLVQFFFIKKSKIDYKDYTKKYTKKNEMQLEILNSWLISNLEKPDLKT